MLTLCVKIEKYNENYKFTLEKGFLRNIFLNLVQTVVPLGSLVTTLLSGGSKSIFIKRKLLKKLFHNNSAVLCEEECIKVFINNQETIIIKYNNINISKEDKGVKLTIDIEKLDLDGLVDRIADDNFNKNIIIRELIKTTNYTFDEKEKIKLIQHILNVANKNNLVNELLYTLTKNDEKIGAIIDSLQLEIGSITLE